MDKKSPDVRKYIAQRANLLGAIRLPNNTFSKNAGTEVTSDILFFQKRENMTDIMPDWVYLDENQDGIIMNKYFVDNPDMILGQMQMVSGRFGNVAECKAFDGIDLKTLLSEAVDKINGEITEYTVGDIEENEQVAIPADPNVKNYSYALIDGKVYFRENSLMMEQDLPITTMSRIKGMIDLRDATYDLIDLQTENYPDENIKVAQNKLNRLYDEYVKKYEQFDDMIWMSGETEIGFETFCRALAKKAGISPRQAKEYVVSNLHNLEHEEAVDALLLALQIIKSENGLEGTQWNKPTCDFLKKEFEKMLGLNDGQANA